MRTVKTQLTKKEKPIVPKKKRCGKRKNVKGISRENVDKNENLLFLTTPSTSADAGENNNTSFDLFKNNVKFAVRSFYNNRISAQLNNESENGKWKVYGITEKDEEDKNILEINDWIQLNLNADAGFNPVYLGSNGALNLSLSNEQNNNSKRLTQVERLKSVGIGVQLLGNENGYEEGQNNNENISFDLTESDDETLENELCLRINEGWFENTFDGFTETTDVKPLYTRDYDFTTSGGLSEYTSDNPTNFETNPFLETEFKILNFSGNNPRTYTIPTTSDFVLFFRCGHFLHMLPKWPNKKSGTLEYLFGSPANNITIQYFTKNNTIRIYVNGEDAERLSENYEIVALCFTNNNNTQTPNFVYVLNYLFKKLYTKDDFFDNTSLSTRIPFFSETSGVSIDEYNQDLLQKPQSEFFVPTTLNDGSLNISVTEIDSEILGRKHSDKITIINDSEGNITVDGSGLSKENISKTTIKSILSEIINNCEIRRPLFSADFSNNTVDYEEYIKTYYSFKNYKFVDWTKGTFNVFENEGDNTEIGDGNEENVLSSYYIIDFGKTSDANVSVDWFDQRITKDDEVRVTADDKIRIVKINDNIYNENLNETKRVRLGLSWKKVSTSDGEKINIQITSLDQDDGLNIFNPNANLIYAPIVAEGEKDIILQPNETKVYRIVDTSKYLKGLNCFYNIPLKTLYITNTSDDKPKVFISTIEPPQSEKDFKVYTFKVQKQSTEDIENTDTIFARLMLVDQTGEPQPFTQLSCDLDLSGIKPPLDLNAFEFNKDLITLSTGNKILVSSDSIKINTAGYIKEDKKLHVSAYIKKTNKSTTNSEDLTALWADIEIRFLNINVYTPKTIALTAELENVDMKSLINFYHISKTEGCKFTFVGRKTLLVSSESKDNVLTVNNTINENDKNIMILSRK